MSIRNFNVNLFPSSAMELIIKRVTDTSVTGKVVDTYIRKMDDKELIVLVMEKFYLRSSRVTLTVTMENLAGVTAVHIVSSGGAAGLVAIDWGAGKSFTSSVEDALASYMLSEE